MVRTQGRRAVVGFRPTHWRLTGYAICANPPLGYVVVTERSSGEDSEQTKWVGVDCPLGRLMSHLPLQRWRLLSVGGAVSNVAPGNVALNRLAQFDPSYTSDVMAAESPPTSADWDFIVVRSICVY